MEETLTANYFLPGIAAQKYVDWIQESSEALSVEHSAEIGKWNIYGSKVLVKHEWIEQDEDVWNLVEKRHLARRGIVGTLEIQKKDAGIKVQAKHVSGPREHFSRFVAESIDAFDGELEKPERPLPEDKQAYQSDPKPDDEPWMKLPDDWRRAVCREMHIYPNLTYPKIKDKLGLVVTKDTIRKRMSELRKIFGEHIVPDKRNP